MSDRSIAWSALLFAATASSALGQQTGDPEAGARLVVTTCAQCHGALDVPAGAPAFVTIAAMPSTTEESLTIFLQTPHASMPNLVLSWADQRDLIAYILSLRP
jgi:mono/diheme cytochrome c family protein